MRLYSATDFEVGESSLRALDSMAERIRQRHRDSDPSIASKNFAADASYYHPQSFTTLLNKVSEHVSTYRSHISGGKFAIDTADSHRIAHGRFSILQRFHPYIFIMFSPLSIFARSHTVVYDYYAYQECIDDRKSQPIINEKRLSTTSTLYGDETNIEKMSSALNIGVIVCSTRKNRICPQVVDFVLNTITQSKNYQSSPNRPQFTKIDLEKWNLPFFDETTIPSQIHSHNDYSQPHTRIWSQEIQKYDSFIFITPQYNWGYPAVLKNAIDFLYNEWSGKPAMIVSYGGHGGDKCNAQLRQVLTSVRMSVTQRSVQLTFPGRDVTVKACKGENLKLNASAKDGIWIAEQKNIRDAFEELVSMPSTNPKYS